TKVLPILLLARWCHGHVTFPAPISTWSIGGTPYTSLCKRVMRISNSRRRKGLNEEVQCRHPRWGARGNCNCLDPAESWLLCADPGALSVRGLAGGRNLAPTHANPPWFT